MNQLSYGWNRHDLEHYDIEAVALSDKLGGPYIPGMSANDIEKFQAQLLKNPEVCAQVKEHTQKKYYLVSLSQTQFYRFNPEKLALVNTEEAQRQMTHDRQWGLVVIPKRDEFSQQSPTLPIYKTLLHHHGLLNRNQPSEEEINAKKQQKQP